MSSPFPTIIVVHPKERRSKCTVEPLRDRDHFVFWKHPRIGPESLDGYVRLGLGGPQLSSADDSHGLLVLDGTWRLAGAMEPMFAHVPVRSLPAWKTAYPRRSKLFEDPGEGLATIEALFVAFSILGRDTSKLLNQYRWAEEFLDLNRDRMTDGRTCET
jgi:pre-rRNA-processing protein TSR3